MCIYANAFITGKNEDTLVLPKSPSGLQASFDGELQPLFVDQFKDVEGSFIILHDGHCLCQYKEWSILLEYIENIRQHNDVDKVPVMVFFSGSEYPNIDKIDIDLELDVITNKPKEGTIMFVGCSIERRLGKNVGNQVSLFFKNGKIVTGTLKDYKVVEEYGEIITKDESVFFGVNEIRHVDAIV